MFTPSLVTDYFLNSFYSIYFKVGSSSVGVDVLSFPYPCNHVMKYGDD